MIRQYKKADQAKLVELLKFNTPKYFDYSEEKDFLEYLELHSQNYFVVENGKEIIGGGGLNYGFDNGKTARISWDIIHPEMQGKGFGTKLTLYRINQIRKNPGVKKIVVRTSQLVHEFYEKIGFELEKKEKDFWAKGFDLYQMKLELNKTNSNTNMV